MGCNWPARSRRVLLAVAITLTSVTATPAAWSQDTTTARPPEIVSADVQPLRPGDIIRLRVWREPDYSGDFPVESNGSAVLPGVGDFNVVGQSAEALRRRLIAAYSEVLLNPSISITVLRRIQVLGAVSRPGLYPVEPTMSISDAIALAGGPTTAARKDRVILVRDGKRIMTNLSAGQLLATSEIRSGDQIVVPEQSRWTNERMFYTLVAAGISIGLTILRYR